MKGRKPKPTALKVAHGNPGKRPIKKEANFKGRPDLKKVSWIGESGKTEWRRMMAEIGDLGVLKASDQSVFAMYCQCYHNIKRAELTLLKEGLTVHEPLVNKAGDIVGYKIKAHPAASISTKYMQLLGKYASLLGFDPTSRTRVHAPTDEPEGPREDDDNQDGHGHSPEPERDEDDTSWLQ